MTNHVLCKGEDISKYFPGTQALNKVNMEILAGEVHGLVGENGAGKSTLVNILSGVYKPDNGSIWFGKKKVEINTPSDAYGLGITTFYQEFALAPNLTVMENICLSAIPKKWMVFADFSEMWKASVDKLDILGESIDPHCIVGDLSISHQCTVGIAKALFMQAKLLIMDEATASLSPNEVEKLFNVLRRLKEKGIAILFISHRLEEVFEISDRITVLRDGKCLGTFKTEKTSLDYIVHLMVGRKLANSLTRKAGKSKEEMLLEVRGFNCPDKFKDVSFHLKRGEILGLTGFVGAGKSELAQSVFGLNEKTTGEIFVEEKKAIINSPLDAIHSGIGLVPEDRKLQALFLQLTVRENITAVNLTKSSYISFVNRREERKSVENWIKELDIHTLSPEQIITSLSGGNQQKLVLARWLLVDLEIFILDEPTHGIDVGAKSEIYTLMRDLAGQKKGIIFISSDVSEILPMSNRVIVMSKGRITGEFRPEDTTSEEIIMYSTK